MKKKTEEEFHSEVYKFIENNFSNIKPLKMENSQIELEEKIRKSYAESVGKKPFNWLQFLNKESYTNSDFLEAIPLSANWATCACGNECSIISRFENGAPFDKILYFLGNDFSDRIQLMSRYKSNGFNFKNAKEQAKNILQKIEDRSTILINQIRKDAKDKENIHLSNS